MTFLQQLINGLHVGSIYALIALGYTMVYGIVKLINFAHGDIMMMGAFAAFVVLTSMGLPIGVVIIVSMIFCGLAGILIERIAYKPLRNAPRISALITAIGVSFALENTFQLLFKPDPRMFPYQVNMEPIEIGGIQISWITILTFILSIVLMIMLQVFIQYTKIGKAMRASSEDKEAAQLMGIDVNFTIAITFAIGSALAAAGGVLSSITYGQIKPLMGVMPGLKAFIAAVLGGIGIIPGAMIGGFIMGIAESLTQGYLSTQWSDAIVFSILIIVLLVKPSGILGKNVREKV